MDYNNKLGKFIYSVISLVVWGGSFVLWIWGEEHFNLSSDLVIFGTVGVIFAWLVVSLLIGRRQQARLPIMKSQATIIDKVQNNHRHGSSYFLSFKLDDGKTILISVDIDIYARYEKGDNGLLSYKHLNPNKDHYLSYRFVDFKKR